MPAGSRKVTVCMIGVVTVFSSAASQKQNIQVPGLPQARIRWKLNGPFTAAP